MVLCDWAELTDISWVTKWWLHSPSLVCSPRKWCIQLLNRKHPVNVEQNRLVFNGHGQFATCLNGFLRCWYFSLPLMITVYLNMLEPRSPAQSPGCRWFAKMLEIAAAPVTLRITPGWQGCTTAGVRGTSTVLLAGWQAGPPGYYPLVNIQKAIEDGHRNSEFSH